MVTQPSGCLSCAGTPGAVIHGWPMLLLLLAMYEHAGANERQFKFYVVGKCPGRAWYP